MCGQPVRTITHTVEVWRMVKNPGIHTAKRMPDYKNLRVIKGSFSVGGRGYAIARREVGVMYRN
jgi:hypothetical protein